MKLNDYKKIKMQSAAFRSAYEKKDLPFEMAKILINARLVKGFTQTEVAKKMGTGQSSIARSESGDYLPSLSLLERLAKVYDTELVLPNFRFLEAVESTSIGSAQHFQMVIVDSNAPLPTTTDTSLNIHEYAPN